MPPLDLELADGAIRTAAAELGRRMPASYPSDPVTAYREARGRRGWGTVVLVAETAEELLQRAVAQEASARRAQGQLVRALRHLGGASRSWAGIGKLTGMTQQGAHSRFRAIATQPRPQLTIDDAAIA